MRWFTVLALILISAPVSLAAIQVTTVAEVDAGSGGIEIDSAGNVYSSERHCTSTTWPTNRATA